MESDWNFSAGRHSQARVGLKAEDEDGSNDEEDRRDCQHLCEVESNVFRINN